VKWHDGLPGKKSIDSMVHLTDWLPTLLAMCGIVLPDDHLPIDGWDVLPVLRGQGGKVNPTRFWQWNRYFPYIGSNAAMRDGDWKLVHPRAPQTTRPEDGALDQELRKDPSKFPEIRPGPTRAEMSYGPPSKAELYDLHADPLEQHDLAAQQPERVAAMQRELEKWFEQVEADRRQCPDAVFK